MRIEDYDAKIELAFYGTGGGIVKENYDEAVRGTETLADVCGGVREWVDSDLTKYDDTPLATLPVPSNDEEFLHYLDAYTEIGSGKCSHPELCGTVAGILFRDGKKEEALMFLGVHDTDEPIYWDS